MSEHDESNNTQFFIGKKFSLISWNCIRYEGSVYDIDIQNSKITLKNVRSFGTEDRGGSDRPFIAPSNEFYKYIVFQGTEIKEMNAVNEDDELQDEQQQSQAQNRKQAEHRETQHIRQTGGSVAQQHLQQQQQQESQVLSHQTTYNDHGSYSALPQHFQQPPMKPPAGKSGYDGTAAADANSWQNPVPNMQQQVQFGTATVPGPPAPSSYTSYESMFFTPPASFNDGKLSLDNPSQDLEQKPSYPPHQASSVLTQPSSLVQPNQQENSSNYFAPQTQNAPPPPLPTPPMQQQAPLAQTMEKEKTFVQKKEVSQPAPVQSSIPKSTHENKQPNQPDSKPKPPQPPPPSSSTISAKEAAAAAPPEPKPKPKTFAAAVGGQSVSSASSSQGGAYNTRPGTRPMSSSNASTRRQGGVPNKTGAGTGAGSNVAQKAKFTEEFDFVSSNSKFKKDEVFGSLRNEKSKKSGSSKGEKGSNSDENLPPNGGAAYEKDDFFDTISCETLDRENARNSRGGYDRNASRVRYAEQRRLDVETFGNMTITRNENDYVNRGRGRGGRYDGYNNADRNRHYYQRNTTNSGYTDRGRQQQQQQQAGGSSGSGNFSSDRRRQSGQAERGGGRGGSGRAPARGASRGGANRGGAGASRGGRSG